jgi:hypothetical protein
LTEIPGRSGKFMITQSGDFAILIGGSARPFYLPKDIQQYQEYYDLLNVERGLNILKLTIGERTAKGEPIVKVEVPDEKSAEYLKAKQWQEYFLQQCFATGTPRDFSEDNEKYSIPENANAMLPYQP